VLLINSPEVGAVQCQTGNRRRWNHAASTAAAATAAAAAATAAQETPPRSKQKPKKKRRKSKVSQHAGADPAHRINEFGYLYL